MPSGTKFGLIPRHFLQACFYSFLIVRLFSQPFAPLQKVALVALREALAFRVVTHSAHFIATLRRKNQSKFSMWGCCEFSGAVVNARHKRKCRATYTGSARYVRCCWENKFKSHCYMSGFLLNQHLPQNNRVLMAMTYQWFRRRQRRDGASKLGLFTVRWPTLRMWRRILLPEFRKKSTSCLLQRSFRLWSRWWSWRTSNTSTSAGAIEPPPRSTSPFSIVFFERTCWNMIV